MKIEYDPALIEDVVFLEIQRQEAEGDRRLLREHRRRLDPLYEEFPPEKRDRAFADVDAGFFIRLGFEKVLLAILAECPCLAASVDLVVARKTASHAEEGAELFVRREHGTEPRRVNTVVLKVQPRRFLGSDDLPPFLRHELMHVSDMVDGGFGYDPDFSLPGRTQAEESLVKDRYEVLWDMTIDGGISRAGKRPYVPKEKREQAFSKLFPWKSSAEFEEIWNTERPTHAALVALARESGTAPASHGGGDKTAIAGSSCPLCSFPTHVWAEIAGETATATAERIREISLRGHPTAVCVDTVSNATSSTSGYPWRKPRPFSLIMTCPRRDPPPTPTDPIDEPERVGCRGPHPGVPALRGAGACSGQREPFSGIVGDSPSSSSLNSPSQ